MVCPSTATNRFGRLFRILDHVGVVGNIVVELVLNDLGGDGFSQVVEVYSRRGQQLSRVRRLFAGAARAVRRIPA